jgi:hypothetical protein
VKAFIFCNRLQSSAEKKPCQGKIASLGKALWAGQSHRRGHRNTEVTYQLKEQL